MLVTIVLFTILAAAGTIAWQRVPRHVRDLLARFVRDTRIRLGNYNLRTLVACMADEILDSAFAGVRQSFVPPMAVFGMHPADVTAYGGLFPLIAEELANVVQERVEGDPSLCFPSGTHGMRVELVTDATAQPGRPSLAVTLRSGRDEVDGHRRRPLASSPRRSVRPRSR